MFTYRSYAYKVREKNIFDCDFLLYFMFKDLLNIDNYSKIITLKCLQSAYIFLKYCILLKF